MRFFAVEIASIIETFRRHDEQFRANAAAERVRRHALAFLSPSSPP
jgi:hypothetical protein